LAHRQQAFLHTIKAEVPILERYRRHHAVDVAAVYVKMNGIIRLEVCRHHLGGPGYQLWEMTGETTGFPHWYRFQRQAIRVAKELAEFTGLPLKVIRTRRQPSVV
jgi:hypothetical protein